MNFTIFLPVAGTSVNILVLLALGGLVGFLSGLFGVGGGFLMTPLLMMIGVPPTVAAASDSNQIVAASTSGTFAHARAGTVDFKMGVLLFVGGILGGTVGVYLIRFLHAMGEADFLINITYVVMLGGIGSYMFFESLGGLRGKRRAEAPREKPSAYAQMVKALPWKMDFRRSGITLSPVMPFVLVRRHPGGDHGRGRRLHHGPGDGLPPAHAHARRRGHEPVPDPVHLHQRHHPAI
jgi:hypothetical protein